MSERASNAGGAGDAGNIDGRLMRALERRPAVTVPEDFALRVAARLPASAAALGPTIHATYVGRRVAWAAAALLLLATIALAPSAMHSNAKRWLEFAFEVEFVALAAWMALRPMLQL
jgi:hypothetical protein